jgi:hypothetical protein
VEIFVGFHFEFGNIFRAVQRKAITFLVARISNEYFPQKVCESKFLAFCDKRA